MRSRQQKCSGAKKVELPLISAWGTKRAVRDGYGHSKDGDDLELWDALSEDRVAESERSIVAWLDAAATALGLDRHPDTKALVEPYTSALGTIEREQNSSER